MNARIERLKEALSDIGAEYHRSACPEALVAAVAEAGFPPGALDGIYCGRNGRAVHELTPRLSLVQVWHRMESGRYEVICYLT